jgi:glycosyltransferase involved in cell wall biosynthesis
MGRAVISTNIDGIPELLENGRGFIVESSDEHGLEQKIRYCVANDAAILDAGNRAAKYMQEYPRWSDLAKSLATEILPSLAIN